MRRSIYFHALDRFAEFGKRWFRPFLRSLIFLSLLALAIQVLLSKDALRISKHTLQLIRHPLQQLSLSFWPKVKAPHRHIKILRPIDWEERLVQFVYVLPFEQAGWRQLSLAWESCPFCLVDLELSGLVHRLAAIDTLSPEDYRDTRTNIKDRLVQLNQIYHGQHRTFLINPFPEERLLNSTDLEYGDFVGLAYGASEVQVNLRFLLVSSETPWTQTQDDVLDFGQTEQLQNLCWRTIYLKTQLPVSIRITCGNPDANSSTLMRHAAELTGFPSFGNDGSTSKREPLQSANISFSSNHEETNGINLPYSTQLSYCIAHMLSICCEHN